MERARRAAAAALAASTLLIGGPRLTRHDPLLDSIPSPQLSTTRSHLRMQGHRFMSATTTFQWRGISAFALVDQEADGRHAEVVRFLDWAAARHLTVVRVFTMARHLFDLAPVDGVRALPTVLELAAARHLHVEAVALADTAAIPLDLDEHVKRVGAIASRYPNAIVEIANEPAHPTQRSEVHDPGVLKRLAALVPAGVPVALGSAEENDAFSGGAFATMHFPRTDGRSEWGHVLALARGAALLRQWSKPVVSDEPIGAAEQFVRGRRDDLPARFRAAALLTRLAGLGATFHYEGGLQARIPAGREGECFDAWNSAWTLLPDDVEQRGTFHAAGEPGAAVAAYAHERAAGVFERQWDNVTWVLAIDVTGEPGLRWAAGWNPLDVRKFEGIQLVSARRAPK